jgi:propanol-preferring alcohol dehydrogenase
MYAYRLLEPQQPPQLVEVPRPSPGPGEVLLRVAACGLCHTDIGLMARTREQYEGIHLPFTLGHEVAGWIEACGDGVTEVRTGEPVAVIPLWGTCGHCEPCHRGEENFCYHIKAMTGGGLGYDGGLAEYMVAPARYVVPTGGYDPVLAAPLTDAGLTTYTAIKPALSVLVPGATAVVIGIGGLGLLAVQFLRTLTGARIVALDTSAERLAVARQYGADDTFPSDAFASARIRDLTRGAGANFVLDCVGAQVTLETAVASLARLGRITLVGAALKTIPFGLHEVPWGAQLTTSLNGGTVNLREVLALANLGRITTLEQRFPLSQVADGYAALRGGTVKGRAVIIPGG